MAAYAARAGLPACVYMPSDTPRANVEECRIAGAEVVLVPGLISDAGRLAGQRAAVEEWFDLSTFKEPYRLEGKKVMGFEIAEAFDWQLPDVIIYPTGGGTGLVGIWKAFAELDALGWLETPRRPRMVAVQAPGCAPVVRAFEPGAETWAFWEDAHTAASGLRVSEALRRPLDPARAARERRHGPGRQRGSHPRGAGAPGQPRRVVCRAGGRRHPGRAGNAAGSGLAEPAGTHLAVEYWYRLEVFITPGAWRGRCAWKPLLRIRTRLGGSKMACDEAVASDLTGNLREAAQKDRQDKMKRRNDQPRLEGVRVSKWSGKYVIGLTGNIGTGKSVVRRMLEHLGAYGIDADALSHRTIAKGAPGYQPVIDLFGRWILTPQG